MRLRSSSGNAIDRFYISAKLKLVTQSHKSHMTRHNSSKSTAWKIQPKSTKMRLQGPSNFIIAMPETYQDSVPPSKKYLSLTKIIV
mmetsp:Transcript_14941/g.28438  ORF Transcript_14941/g.28438 Transcript_14941/m.28438 type:complete len:86 (+) Transcript_14941:121-378(+)